MSLGWLAFLFLPEVLIESELTMAKKAATPAPEASEKVSEEVVISTAPETSESSETPESPETEATTSAVIDQPAVSDDASASSPSSPAEPAIVEPVAELVVHKAGGGFDSPFVEPPAALTMVQRIEILEARIAALESK